MNITTMTYKLSAKNNIPTLEIGDLDIVKAIGIDWNWHTLSKISDSSIRNFFEKLQQAACAVEIPKDEVADFEDEDEQNIVMQDNRLRIDISDPSAVVEWDESLWLYIYEHIGLWKSYIRGRVRFYTDMLHILQTDVGIDKIFSIIRTARNIADAEDEILGTFAIDSASAREILDIRMHELVALSLRSCSAQLVYWSRMERIFNRLT